MWKLLEHVGSILYRRSHSREKSQRLPFGLVLKHGSLVGVTRAVDAMKHISARIDFPNPTPIDLIPTSDKRGMMVMTYLPGVPAFEALQVMTPSQRC